MSFSVFPNPVSTTLQFKFIINEPSIASLKIFDIRGKAVAVVLNETMSFGEHRIGFDINDSPKGIYYSVLNVNHNQITKKLVLY